MAENPAPNPAEPLPERPAGLPQPIPSSGPQKAGSKERKDQAVNVIKSDNPEEPDIPSEPEFRAEVARQRAALEASLGARGGVGGLADAKVWLALDIDGTVIDSYGRVTDRTHAALARASAAGVEIMFSTGRSVAAMLPVAEVVGLRTGWAVCSNGAIICRLCLDCDPAYEVVKYFTFDPAPAIEVVRRAIPDSIIGVEDRAEGFRVSRPFPEGELPETIAIETDEQLASRPVARMILRAPDMPLREFMDTLAAAGLHMVQYAVGWTSWADIGPQGVHKASGLEWTIKQENPGGRNVVIALGDGGNDIEMLGWADHGVAVGTRDQLVIDSANTTCPRPGKDGTAAVITALVEMLEEAL